MLARASLKRAYSTIVFSQAIAMTVALLSLRWMATYVTPENLGKYSLYQSVVAAAGLFLISWPNAAVLRFGREEWTREGRIGTALGARVAIFLGCLLIAIGGAWLADPWIRRLLGVSASPFYWVAAGLVISPTAELAMYVSQAVGRTEAYGYNPLVTRVVFLLGVMIIPAIHYEIGWTYLAGCILIATAAATAITAVALPRGVWSGVRVSSRAVFESLKYSWTLPFAAVTGYVVNWVDSWVIRGIRGVGAVGVYNLAYQTTTLAALTCAPISVMLTPRVIDARVSLDERRINGYAQSILPIVILVSAAVALGMTLIYPILPIVWSKGYADAYPVILILLAAVPFQLLGYLVAPLGNAYERILPKFVLVGICVAITNTIGDLLLVPAIGIAGAAASSAVAFGIGGVLQVFVVRRCATFPPIWHFTAPAVIVVPSVVALRYGGPAIGSGLVVVGVAMLLALMSLTMRRRIGDWDDVTAAEWILRLPRALTLSDAPSNTR